VGAAVVLLALSFAAGEWANRTPVHPGIATLVPFACYALSLLYLVTVVCA
jgi:hypothetical protein